MSEEKRRILIFTDLDGTLLDPQDYSFGEALPALERVRQRKIPLILCSSKTRAELEFYQRELKIDEPFISENGGAVFMPSGYFPRVPEEHKKKGRYLVLEFGVSHAKIRERLLEVSTKLNIKPVGIGDLGAEEISCLLNLSAAEAELAQDREYDEAFYFPEKPKEEQIKLAQREFNQVGLCLTAGGRLFHLHGDHDKGKAAKSLIQIFIANRTDEIMTIGLGDSLNDLSLLEAVDIPVLLKKEDDSYQPEILDNLKVYEASEMGPRGWNRAVLDLIEKYDSRSG
ncbi:MAG: HAD-IIB family hydrolase [Candidatus Zixiibacteriota bacterium]|nr:MAG: HAD-IIB family hydrolase [candidate division Zixibacteria bacterium]